MLYVRKAMSLTFIFIMVFSFFAVFVGETYQDSYELYDSNSDGSSKNVKGDSNNNRGTRADSNNMDLESRPLFGPATDIQVVGNYAYLTTGCSLLIFDITNTNNPVLVGYYDSESIGLYWVLGLYVEGNYAYLARSLGGLDIVNVQTPSSPYHETLVATDAEAIDVNISDSYVYVAETDGMEIFEMSTPTNLVPRGKFDTTGAVANVFISDNFAYIPSEQEGFFIVNITDPDNPTEEGRDDTYTALPYPRDVFVSGDYVFVADYYEGLVTFNIADKTNPQDVGREGTSGYPHEIKIDGSYAFLADEGEGLAIIDVSTPESPTYHMNHDTPGNGDTISVFVENGHAFLADDLYGLKIVDISGDPPSPSDEGNWEKTGNIAWSVHVEGNYAYIADGEAGLVIMDMSNPNDPDYIGNYDTDGNSRAVEVVGDYAYVADDSGGLVVLDVNDPNDPSFDRSYPPLTSYTYDVDVVDSYAYLADYEDGLRIIDLNTDQEWWFNTDGSSYSVQVEGDMAYLGDGGGLRIINVSTPSGPTEEGYYEIIQSGSASMGVHVAGSYAYVATFIFGLHIFDITDPSNPTLVGSYEDEGVSLTGIQAVGTTVYHTTMVDGIIALDTSTPSNIQKTGYYNASGFCLDVEVAGSYAYLSAAIGGVYLLDITQTKDTIRPQIDSHSPISDAVDVPWNSIINMSFTENMDHNSVENAFSITPSITGNFSWEGNNLTFIPEGELSTATLYTVTIDSIAMDTAGNTLTSDYTWQFTTLAIPPVVVSVIPNDGATFILKDANITINFSKSMHKTSTRDAFSYTDGDSTWMASNGLITWSNQDKNMTFTPFDEFENGELYTFTIAHTAADTDGAGLDVDGDGIGGEESQDDYSWSFTIIPTPPQIVTVYPEDSAYDVQITASIMINFTKAMNKASVQDAFSYTNGTTTWDISDGMASWSNGDEFTFVPSLDLQNNDHYIFTLSYSAMDTDDIMLDVDEDGIPGEIEDDNYTWEFATIPSPPIVETISPLKGSTLVLINTTIEIDFSKSMDRESTEDAFKYSDGTSEFSTFNGKATWSNNDKTMTFTPTVKFANDKTYTVTIGSTALDAQGGLFDGDEDGIGGEAEDDDYSWSFTTMPTPPVVSTVSPRNLETRVAVDTQIEIRFSKPMDEFSVEAAFSFTYKGSNKTWGVSDGNLSWSADSKTMTLGLILEHDKEYTFKIDGTAMDIIGITLDIDRDKIPGGVESDDYSWSFTTIKEPPQIVSMQPEEDETDVKLDSNIVITFDRSMNTDSTEKAFSYSYEGSSETFDTSSGSAVWTNSDKILTFNPDIDFEEGMVYTVIIEDTARDKDTISFEGQEWSFTTKANSEPLLDGGGAKEDEDAPNSYKFTIVYTDDDNDEPSEVSVIIDGVSWRMYASEPNDENFRDGKSYEYVLELEGGEHTYYFEAENEKHKIRSPSGSNTETLTVEEKDDEQMLGFMGEEFMGVSTPICATIGIIILVVIIISVMMLVRRRRAGEETTFQTFDEGEAPMTFMAEGEEEIMTFQSFDEPSFAGAEPVVIKCPECDSFLKVKSATRPFKFPCKCGANLILR